MVDKILIEDVYQYEELNDMTHKIITNCFLLNLGIIKIQKFKNKEIKCPE